MPTDRKYRKAVARISATVPSDWYLEALEARNLLESELVAIEVALDELDSYIGALGEDAIAQEQGEVSMEKLRWTSKKLRSLLDTTAEIA